MPYAFFDGLSNPEVIASKTYGGDNEAGIADDGRFSKISLGLVYRPINQVAVKMDVSSHSQRFNGEVVTYPEVRLNVSFGFNALSHRR